MKKFDTVYLHVGLEKTGTTSIQRSLDVHRKQLEALGYYYPKAIAVGRNTMFATMFAQTPEQKPVFNAVLKASGKSIEAYRRDFQNQLQQEFEQTSAKQLIISSEFLAFDTDFEALKKYCDMIAQETIVIIYLREQAALAMSLNSTFIKSGGTDFGSVGQLLSGKLPLKFNFKTVVQRLELSFPSRLKVRIFEKSAMINGDAVGDFCSIIGLKEKANELSLPRENKALSQVGAEFLAAVNTVFPNFVDGNRNAARSALIQDLALLDDSNVSAKLTFTPVQARQIKQLCHDSNEWVRKKYFPKRTRLFPPYKGQKKSKISQTDALTLAGKILEKAYSDMQSKQDILNEIAPLLTDLSKRDLDISPDLKALNRRIIQDRES